MSGLILLVNDNHVDNNRKEILMYVYFGSIANDPKITYIFAVLFVFMLLRFYGPVNPVESYRARSIYLTTRLLGRLSPVSG